MTLVSSLPSSTASVNEVYNNKRLPKGIHIIGADDKSAPRVGGIPQSEGDADFQNSENKESQVPLPWGYIFIRHMSAAVFETNLETREVEGNFKPKCFVHRTVKYKRNLKSKGIIKEEKPTVSGLVFLQGKTEQLRNFLTLNYPQYFLVNDCSTGKPAIIADSVMRTFIHIMKEEPERVTFLRDPFVKFAQDHVKLRILTGSLAGQEGYVVRILRNRQLVMNIGGYAVAINNVHNEDFEIAE